MWRENSQFSTASAWTSTSHGRNIQKAEKICTQTADILNFHGAAVLYMPLDKNVNTDLKCSSFPVCIQLKAWNNLLRQPPFLISKYLKTRNLLRMYAHVIFFSRHCHFADRSPADISAQDGNYLSLTSCRDLKAKYFWRPSPSLPLPKAFSPYSRRCMPMCCLPSHLMFGPTSLVKGWAPGPSEIHLHSLHLM